MRFLRKIRARILFLFLLVGVLPPLALGALLSARSFDLLRAGIERDNARVADQVVRLVEARFDEMRRDVERLAADPAVRSFRADELTEKLRLFFAFVPLFYNVHLYDTEGTLRAVEYYTAYNDKRDKVGASNYRESPPAIRACLERAVANGESAVSDLILNSSGERIVVVAAPVFAAGLDGRVAGVLSAALKIEDIYFHRILESVSLDPGRYVVIADPEGTVLSALGAIPQDLARFDFPGTRPYLREADEEYDGLVDLNGRKDYIACRGLPYVAGNLITGGPYRLAFAPVAGMLRTVFQMVAAVAILFSMLAYAVGSGLSAPIGRLIAGLARIKEGAYAHRLPETGDDEFAEAACAFNDLAEKLHRNSVIEALWRDGSR